MFERLERKLDQLMLDISALTAAVATETTVDQSAVTLLTQLTAQIQTLIAQSGNTVDPAALQAIVNTINANATNLASAVTTNTPAATPSTPSASQVVASVKP